MATLANGERVELDHGAVAIAAITSCTNTSNPYVMVAAGLLAKKAVEKGLQTPPWVKTSLAPGSRVVTDYYNKAGLTQYLDKLRFQTVGYGCTTCIGNSGPLPTDISKAIEDHSLVAVSVLSGNRNFEGRISPEVRANYLMSPPLVVAYALAGHIGHNFQTDPLGKDQTGQPVYLRDIWPTQQEVAEAVNASIDSTMFRKQYSTVADGDANWQNLKFPSGNTYGWEPDSTYIRKAPYFDGMTATPPDVTDIRAARCLAVLGDSVTTDHISPAGSIKKNGPAGQYLASHGVAPADFNSYGSRRGNHEVMVRGTFANVRLRNKLAPGRHGHVHLRRVGHLCGAWRPPLHPRRQGVRFRLIARLGRQRPAPARHQVRHRRVVRTHPPLQPRRHGHPALPVPRRAVHRLARPLRRRDLHHRRPPRRT
jgi:aconitate hydratase